MILIADSGATKTHWVTDSDSSEIGTKGLNPNTVGAEEMHAALHEVAQALKRRREGQPQHIFFYGAGCGTEANKQLIASLLHTTFPTADITVESDLLGACRAALGDKQGFVGILGTGSNACYYNGCQVVRKTVSLGYMLGDEGSATHLGRQLLADYLHNKLPKTLHDAFRQAYPLTTAQWIDRLYHQPQPNLAMASLAPFITSHSRSPYIRTLMRTAFSEYIDNQVVPIFQEQEALHLVGSLAAAAETVLRQEAADRGIAIGRIIASPIEGLRDYHKMLKKQKNNR